MTVDVARQRLKGYVRKYYGEVRPDVLDRKAFEKRLYGYVVSLSHDIARKRGWQGHNWRQGLRDNLLSFALDEVDKVDRTRRV